MKVVAFVPDLMDRSKVAAAAPGATFAADLDALTAAAAGADLVLVDLARPGVVVALPAVVAAAADAPVVGFGSHVEDGLLAAAADAGCREVLPRSRFFRRLSERLASGST